MEHWRVRRVTRSDSSHLVGGKLYALHSTSALFVAVDECLGLERGPLPEPDWDDSEGQRRQHFICLLLKH